MAFWIVSYRFRAFVADPTTVRRVILLWLAGTQPAVQINLSSSIDLLPIKLLYRGRHYLLWRPRKKRNGFSRAVAFIELFSLSLSLSRPSLSIYVQPLQLSLKWGRLLRHSESRGGRCQQYQTIDIRQMLITKTAPTMVQQVRRQPVKCMPPAEGSLS